MSRNKSVALAALGVVGLTAGMLFALPSASAVAVGGASLSPASGGSGTVISLNTQGPCAAPAVKVRAIAVGFGFPAAGQIIYSPQTVGFSTTAPMSLAVSNAFVVYANNNSTALVGDYDIRVQCVNSLGNTIYDEYTAVMSWVTPGNTLANIDAATYTSAPTNTAPPTTAPPTTTAPPVPLPVKLTSPYLVGSARVGSTLACRVGSWSRATALSIRWLRNGVAITGGINSTYRLTSADYLKYVSCRVIASNAGGSVAAFSNAPRIGAGTFVNTRAPYLTGTARVGRTLFAARGSWSPAPTSYSYQWLRNGSPISKATRSYYVASSADRGRYISVRVTVKAAGYTTTYRNSKSARIS